MDELEIYLKHGFLVEAEYVEGYGFCVTISRDRTAYVTAAASERETLAGAIKSAVDGMLEHTDAIKRARGDQG